VQSLFSELGREGIGMSKKCKKAMEKVVDLSFEEFKEKLPSMKEDINKFWDDDAVKTYVAETGIEEVERESQLRYVMSRIEELSEEDFIPKETDVVRARQRTTGFERVEFITKHKEKILRWSIMDMGGQKTEQRKWPQIIKTVRAVIFCLSLVCFFYPRVLNSFFCFFFFPG